MQTASLGAQRIPRQVSNTISRKGHGNITRSIHTPAFARSPSTASGGHAKRILSQAHTVLSRFVGHLTAPGLSAHSTPSFPQAVRGSALSHMSTIQERLSFTARHTLSRPVQPLYFPRGPAFVSRSVTQVGLGTARNFSSARSVFQNFVENVPIAGRALYEADWEVRFQKERDAMTKTAKGKNVKRDRKEMLKAKDDVFTSISLLESASEPVSEMDCYLATAMSPSVTTHLLIPLAPTSTPRVPLSSDVPDRATLLPLPALVSIHNSHELHSLRVSAIFSRLDAAKVWEKGVFCSAYSERGGDSGVCTILKVEFVGWTIAEVRSVIGESGTGWCALEETVAASKQEQDEEEDTFSDVSSLLSTFSGDESMHSCLAVEPAQSLVLPTLDFSSFVPPAVTSSHNDLFLENVSDPWANLSSNLSSDDSWVEHNRLEFSSDFFNRLDTHY